MSAVSGTSPAATAPEMAAMLAQLHQQQGSDVDSGGEGPPDSPVASAGAFTTHSGGLNLDDEFFAIPASEGGNFEFELILKFHHFS